MSMTVGAQTVVRALTLLSYFTDENPSRSALELSKLAGLKQSTTHRLLITLESLDYLERESNGRFQLGLPVIALASVALAQQQLYRLSLPILNEISLATSLSSTLSVHLPSRRKAMYVVRIDTNETPRGVNSTGKLVPLHASAVGRVLLASLECDTLTELGEVTGVAQEAELEVLKVALEEVRDKGYALDQGELIPNRSALAVPVRDGVHQVVAALALSGSCASLNQERVPELIGVLSGGSDAISYALGNTNVYT